MEHEQVGQAQNLAAVEHDVLGQHERRRRHVPQLKKSIPSEAFRVLNFQFDQLYAGRVEHNH